MARLMDDVSRMNDMKSSRRKYYIIYLAVALFFIGYLISYFYVRQYRLSLQYVGSTMLFSSQEEAQQWLNEFNTERDKCGLMYGENPLIYLFYWPVIQIDSLISGRKIESPYWGMTYPFARVTAYRVPKGSGIPQPIVKTISVSWGKPINDLMYGISIHNEKFVHGSGIPITVHVKNLGKQEKRVLKPYHHVSEFIVTDSSGKVVNPQLDCCKKHLSNDQYTPEARFVLEPGELNSYTIDILEDAGCGLMYSLKPGDYSIEHHHSGKRDFKVMPKNKMD